MGITIDLADIVAQTLSSMPNISAKSLHSSCAIHVKNKHVCTVLFSKDGYYIYINSNNTWPNYPERLDYCEFDIDRFVDFVVRRWL